MMRAMEATVRLDAVVAGEPVLVSRSRKKVFLDELNNYISGVAK